METVSSIIAGLKSEARAKANDIVTEYINNKKIEKKVRKIWKNLLFYDNTGFTTLEFSVPKEAWSNPDIKEYIYNVVRSYGYGAGIASVTDENGATKYVIQIHIYHEDLGVE